MAKVTWPQVLTWRTRRHFLDRADGGGPVEVARRPLARTVRSW